MQMHGLGKCHGGHELFPFLNDQRATVLFMNVLGRALCPSATRCDEMRFNLWEK